MYEGANAAMADDTRPELLAVETDLADLATRAGEIANRMRGLTNELLGPMPESSAKIEVGSPPLPEGSHLERLRSRNQELRVAFNKMDRTLERLGAAIG